MGQCGGSHFKPGNQKHERGMGIMNGLMRCRQCRRTWVVESKTAETVTSRNHAFLNPGHQTVTVWKPAQQHAGVPA